MSFIPTVSVLQKVMASGTDLSLNEARRRKVLVGNLPSHFLRITGAPKLQQEAADHEAALALYHDYSANSKVTGTLNITVDEAKLVKNYGVTRMDPYVKVKVGRYVYETNADPSGGRNPHWKKVVSCLLPQGVNHIYVEIYDECSFTADELIAWANIPIPEAVLAGETVENWYPLNGRQGEAKEGYLNIILSYMPVISPYLCTNNVTQRVVMVPSTDQGGLCGFPRLTPVPVYTQPPVQTAVLDTQVLSQIEEMFPNIKKSIVKLIYEANRGNKDATVNSLLEISE